VRTWLWNWGPALAQMAAIFYLSSQHTVPDLPGGLNNYTGHALGYGLLAALVLRALSRATWAGVRMGTAVRAVIFSSAYGITDEFHQSFVSNRTTDVHDWMADTAGAAFAVLLILRIAIARRRRERNE
jgi:VanZ family protein